MHHASKNSPLFPSYPMTKKVNSSLRANGGETHTLKIRICVWKNKNKKALSTSDCLLSCLWYITEFSEVRLTFSGPLLSTSGALIVSMAEAPCHHEPVLMGRHLVWCRGILGLLTPLHRFLFFFFFLRKSRKRNGQLLPSLVEACIWTLLKDVTVSTGQPLGRPRWGKQQSGLPV